MPWAQWALLDLFVATQFLNSAVGLGLPQTRPAQGGRI